MSKASAIAPPYGPAAVERRSGPIGFTVSLLAHLLLIGMLITGGDLFRGEEIGAIAVAEVTLISVSEFGALDPQRPDLPVEEPPPPPQVQADQPPEASQTVLSRPPPASAPAVQPPPPPVRTSDPPPLPAQAEPAPTQLAFAAPEPSPSPEAPPPPQLPSEPTPPPPPPPVSRPEPPPDTSEETIAALESLLEQDSGAQDKQVDPIASLTEQVEQLERESVRTPRQLSGRSGALSVHEYAYMRDRLAECWNVGAILGARNAAQLRVTVLVELSTDGKLVGAPQLVSPNPPPTVAHAHAYAEARRAVRCGEPYTGLDQANYSSWRQIELTFDPEGMMGQ